MNLLIDLFWMAMTGSRWELAFPDTVRAAFRPLTEDVIHDKRTPAPSVDLCPTAHS